MATQIPTPFISPGFQCFQGTSFTDNGAVSASGDPVNLFRSKSGDVFTAPGTPSGLTLETVTSRYAFEADPANSVEFSSTLKTHGHLEKFHFLAWVKYDDHDGANLPSAVHEFGFETAGAVETYLYFDSKSGQLGLGGQLAYHILPSTTGTRTWNVFSVGNFGSWYLISLEVNMASSIYRLRAYNTSGSLLASANTSSSVPANARMRCDSGDLIYNFFNVSDGTNVAKFGKCYRAVGETFTDAQIQSIIAAGFGDFVTSPVGTIDPVEITYTPTAPASATLQRIRIHRGQAYAIKFVPDELQAVSEDEYEARLGVISDGTYTQFSVNDGNMTVDEDTGEITIDISGNDTSALSLSEPVFFELWRTDEDDNSVPVARAKVVVVETLGN